jgi:hypothetical protein
MGLVYQDSGVATFSDSQSGHVYVFAGGNVSAGDLLILGVNIHGDGCPTPSGFTIASFDVSTPQGIYVFFKYATGGEQSVTITTSIATNVALTYLRYSGANALPLDEAAIGHSVTMVQESPTVLPNALFGYDELGILFSFNDNSTSTQVPDPIWPVGYTRHLNTGPGTIGYGTSTTVQQFVSTRVDATGVETPQISWTGGGFVNRTSIFVAFSTVATQQNEASSVTLGVSTLATLTKTTKLVSTATFGATTSARISKTISIAMSVRIIDVMNVILSAVKTALIPTPGGAIALPVLAPSVELVGVDDQLSVTVDYTFRVNTPVFEPIETDTAATAAYLVVVFKVSVFRTLTDIDLLTPATSVTVADALATRVATQAALTSYIGIEGVHGFQMGTQSYTRAGSSLAVFVRMEF